MSTQYADEHTTRVAADTILCGAYIVSRGLSKIGRGDGHIDRND